MQFADALQAYYKYTTTEQATAVFLDPLLNQMYDDEAAGLCTITMLTPDSITAIVSSDSELEVTYTDPELEFLRQLMV